MDARSAPIDETALAEIQRFAVQLAKDAGQMLLAAVELRAGKTVREGHVEKESAVDLVTQTDEGQSPLLVVGLEGLLATLLRFCQSPRRYA